MAVLEVAPPGPLTARLLLATFALNVDTRFANRPPPLPTPAVPEVRLPAGGLPPGAVAVAAVIMRCALTTEIWFAQKLAPLIDAGDIGVLSKKIARLTATRQSVAGKHLPVDFSWRLGEGGSGEVTVADTRWRPVSPQDAVR